MQDKESRKFDREKAFWLSKNANDVWDFLRTSQAVNLVDEQLMSTLQRNNSFRWIFLVPILSVVALAATGIGLSLYFHATAPSGTPYYGWYGWPFFGFGWFFIIPVFFLVFFGFRWFLWGGRGWGYYGRYHDTALETLRERFARGEITKEQFDEMARKLKES